MAQKVVDGAMMLLLLLLLGLWGGMGVEGMTKNRFRKGGIVR